ncbi:SDR family NAD(P)-dependent oxidoreductase [Hymenobacter sp. DG25A]|uniref:SDR family NAD(P)-dependent oxidoreductase n=1 Tax=Hymenobacter sp. DG25A TaxID=1385663 RepID=UPI0006BCF776|nr:SDR family oxidoreductase [Hymenobacter sp. DG25A]ALD21442.1 3-oxoacyl-ACP reductase [Hymenobacter sp. DG25A]
MNLQLDQKTVLVTASTGGIGLEIARSFAREGAIVIINGRTAASVQQAIAQLRQEFPEAELLPLVADNGTAEGAAQTIHKYPEVDVLVNNLGIYEATEFFDTTDESWLRLFEVNIMSGVRLSRHYLRGMLARTTGRIIFISSESAMNPAPEMAHYSATKLMQLSISRSLAEMTKGSNVTVNALMPGSTHTPGVEEFIRQVFPDEKDYATAERRFMAENRPTSLIGRLIQPREIADFTVFVASPLAGAINGASLRVDGGIVRSAV